MIVYLYILLLVLVPILIIGLPIILLIWLNKISKRRNLNPKWRILFYIPIFVVGYFIYDGIYPSSEFYKIDFKEVTEMKFPESGKIIYKTASFPDLHGDYTSSFLVEFDESDLTKIENKLKNDGFEEKENNMNSSELDYIENKKGQKKYSKVYTRQLKNGKHYSVGFLDDNKTVIITRVSW